MTAPSALMFGHQGGAQRATGSKPVMGKVAIQALGAKFKPTKPLMAMKVTLLIRKKP